MPVPPDQPPNKTRMVSYIISPPVREAMESDPERLVPVIINMVVAKDQPDQGLKPAKQAVKAALENIGYDPRIRESEYYIFADLKAKEILSLAGSKHVYQIWLDEVCKAHLLSSVETVKAAPCWRTFDGRGKGITWAVLDTGIRYDHPHFAPYQTIDRQLSKSFSSSPSEEDRNGHGTHVAGIIAGAVAARADGTPYRQATFLDDALMPKVDPLDGLPSGVAPLTKLVNVKVLNDDASGSVSMAILGLEYVRNLNEGTRQIRIDGVNMSLGYPFDPKVYGCGHSPLCDEVRRAVNSGLVVVISCGNEGYGTLADETPVYVDLSIADPGNTEEAITVGAVHKGSPHVYGVSYFSSKGPTGDGRMKPDLVAPGEKVISCSIHFDDPNDASRYEYVEMSGTSMAAPHVSGAIAAFLSVHREYRGSPGEVKDIFLKTATDLGRQRSFQGAGLVDVLRAVMSV